MRIKLIFILGCLLVYMTAKPQSFCPNNDFEEGSLTSPVPGTITVAAMNAVNGWTATSGSNTGSVTSCNLNGCCPSNPNSIQLIGAATNTGYIDPNIGASFPVFSQFGSFFVPNSGLGYGDWFCKLNDDISNKSIHKISSSSTSIPFVMFKKVAILPVMSISNHACCSAPAIKIVLKDGSGNIISSPNFSITPTTSCSGVYNWSVCPMNSSLQFSPWQVFWFPVMSNTLTSLEVTVADCADGAHLAYSFLDSECFIFDLTANGIPNSNINNSPVTVCGSTCATLAAPLGFNSYLWNGPDPNVNGATTSSVNACQNGVYTITVNGSNFMNPYPITFTLNCVPNPTTNLSVSQTTACVGGNTITLSGSPSGGVYSGSFITGNSFYPSAVGNYSVQYSYTDSNGCKDSSTTNINVISCTGINEDFSFSNTISLYPQPAKDLVNISLNYFYEPTVSIKITDVNGKIIRIENLIVRNGKAQIETSEFPNGVYTLQLISKNQIAQKRLIIAR